MSAFPLPGSVPSTEDFDSTAALRRILSELLEEHRKKADEHHAEILAAVASINDRLPEVAFPLSTCITEPESTKGAGTFAAEQVAAVASARSSVSIEPASRIDKDLTSQSLSSKEISGRVSRPLAEKEKSEMKKKQSEDTEDEATPPTWRDMVRHRNFDLMVSCLIAISVVFTFVEQQLLGYDADVALGLVEGGHYEGAMVPVIVMEQVLNAIFLIEVCVRIAADGCKAYFSLKANWFDFLIVMAGAIDSYILRRLAARTGQNLSVIRLVRLVRVVRTMRAARQLRVLQPLNVLIRTIISSCLSLFWSLVVLGIFHLTAAMMLAQALHPFVMDDTNDLPARLWVNQMYGSGTKSLYTFFEITYSGGWPAKVRPLVEDVGWGYAIFFLFYITWVFFAIVRIISAMFLKDTLAEAAKDEKWAVEKREEDKLRTADKIKELFVRADLSGDGTVSAEEFQDIFSNSQTRTWCELMDLDVSEVDGLFELLDDGDGLLRYQEFMEGMVRLKGPASSRDVLVIMRDCQKIATECRRLRGMLVDVHKAMAISPARAAAPRLLNRQASAKVVRTNNLSVP